jgi:hypothetical protein
MPTIDDPPLLTDSDVDSLTWQFLNSAYVGDAYANRSLDQRLHHFLRHNGLVRVADDGDLYNLILDRVMSNIRCVPRTANQSHTARPRSPITDPTK